MKFITQSHREGDILLAQERYKDLYKEITDVISSISDNDIKSKHKRKYDNKMSLSYAINDLLKDRFIQKGWLEEAPIFQDADYDKESKWRLDFAKDSISIEVGFNHGEAIAWNLLKPVLASEMNHVKKAIQTKIGVVICATAALKVAGAFDGAVGEFEKICKYLIPLDRILTVPMVIIGLKPPETFMVIKKKVKGRNIGIITDF